MLRVLLQLVRNKIFIIFVVYLFIPYVLLYQRRVDKDKRS